MNDYLYLFPLNLVAFPNEKLNLHIFEPRYRQLINECLEKNQTFGIPAYLKNKVQSLGTEMRILELVNTYPDGRMDIRTEGIRTFKILKFDNPTKGKPYSGGDVVFHETDTDGSWVLSTEILELLEKLYEILQVPIPFDFSIKPLSFHIAHKIGFSIDQEYNLLNIHDEEARLEVIISHLKKTIPMVRELERTKELVQMNGHFKNLDPLDL